MRDRVSGVETGVRSRSVFCVQALRRRSAAPLPAKDKTPHPKGEERLRNVVGRREDSLV